MSNIRASILGYALAVVVGGLLCLCTLCSAVTLDSFAGPNNSLIEPCGATLSGDGKQLTFASHYGKSPDWRCIDQHPEIERLHIYGSPITDEVLIHVAKANRLQELCLSGSNMRTKDGLSTLKGLTSLSSLLIPEMRSLADILPSLRGFPALSRLTIEITQPNDSDVRMMSDLKSLRSLQFDASKTTALGLDSLKDLPNLEELTISGPLRAAQLQSIADLRLRKLKISTGYNTVALGLAVIGKISTLRHLDIHAENLTDEVLPSIGRLRNLEWLQLDGEKVSDSGMAHLASLSNLRTIALIHTNITDKSVKLLAGMPMLEVVQIPGARITDAGLANLATLQNLRELDVSRAKGVQGHFLSDTHGWKNLRSIAANNSGFDDSAIRGCGSIKRLERLDVAHCCHVTDASIAFLSGLAQLTSLKLLDTAVTGEGLAKLHSVPNLKESDFDYRKSTDDFLCNEELMREQRRLLLSHSQITVRGLKCICRSPSLQHLDVSHTDTTNDALQEIAKLQGLQHLNLSNTLVTDEGLSALKQLKELQYLDLSDNEITGSGLESLQSLPKLRVLNAERTRVSDSGVRFLSGFQQLETLNLQETNLTDAGMSALAGIPRLKSLNIVINQITDSGIELLAKARNLENLNASANRISGWGLSTLRDLPRLSDLSLVQTQLVDSYLPTLSGFKHLQRLQIYDNNLSKEALMDLIKNLKGCSIQGRRSGCVISGY
jgi:internalin A